MEGLSQFLESHRLLPYLLYIDPGNGALLLQVLLAALTGALFYFRKFFLRFKRFFVRDNSPKNDQ
jgi:hypothetical protein